ncbi:MAG: hypothetical protein CMD87_00465 [Gammaproteobacteria bacterium]|nr:hypothetical protein [Gammaproteobacteria bacterium]
MFFKSRYFLRAFLGYALVTSLGACFILIASLNNSESRSLHELEDSMQVTAKLLAGSISPATLADSSESLKLYVKKQSEISSLRITLIDLFGGVLADSHQDPLAMDNHLRRPEIQAALVTGIGSTNRYSSALGQEYRYLALPVNSTGGVIGFVRVAKPLTEISAMVRGENSVVTRNTIVIVTIVLVLGFIFFGYQANRIDAVSSIAKDIASGKFDTRIPAVSGVGLSGIAESFNRIARRSEQNYNKVAKDRNRLATVFTCMVEGVIDVDLTQNVLHINDAAARLLSVEPQYCVGQPIWHAIRNQDITDALDSAIQNNSVVNIHVDFQRASSSNALDVYAASLRNDRSEPIGAVLVLHDVTHLRNLERVRTDFVANASHELKTPITAIRAITETLLEAKEIEKEKSAHFLERLHVQSLRLAQLIDDLMTISRLESNRGKEEFLRTNINELVINAVRVAEGSATERGLRIITELPDTDLYLFVDSFDISQLIDNLLDNAIKYTEEGGLITITLESDEEKVRLRVSDDGLGISDEDQKRIFERFYRVEKARAQSLGGTGLGLSIVRNIAEKHNGTVGLESTIGVGSSFTFCLPLEHRVELV